jgi:hypothetical protein
MSGFACGSDRRRRLVRAAAESQPINGIDFLEVDAADQRSLQVRFLAGHGVAGLTPDQFAVDGGVRVTGITVTAISTHDDTASISVSEGGDFSPYTLRLRTAPTNDAVPAPFDPRLAAVQFSFKAGCPDPFDCAPDHRCPVEPAPLPDLDYLAKDYESFRQLMLDRLSVTAPEWTERNPADLLITLVELLAAAADEQSYTQDAIATEAYLGTARLRRSVRRHARLLGYHAHDGCNARAFVRFTADAAGPPGGVTVPAGTQVFTGTAGPAATSEPPPADAAVFRTMHPVTVFPRHDRLAFHPWGETECCLPAGATGATLLGRTAGGQAVHLAPGDLLLLEETADPGSRVKADADPERRHVVRLTEVTAAADPLDGTEVLEVAWGEADALPRPLCVVVEDDHGLPVPVAAAAAGIAVAENARTLVDRPLVPDAAPHLGLAHLTRPYRPRLPDPSVTFNHPYRADEPAAAQLVRDPIAARADVAVHIGADTWEPPPARDLLHSGPQDRHVLVETEHDGRAWLRFGDGVHGARPPTGADGVTAHYRVGNGTAGNIGRDVLRRVTLPPGTGIAEVVNPLPAAGGIDPESVERIRVAAPEAFREQQRAVTAEDYARALDRHPQVHRAHATLRWTGSWYTVFVAVDLLGGRQLDADAESDLRRHLDRYRMAGQDLKFTGPELVALDLRLRVCAEPGAGRRDVEARLLERLSSRRLPDGTRGLFHPDRFTFGQPVYLSEVYAAALEVAGVDWLVATRFQRWGRAPADELENEVLRPAEHEIVQLAGDQNFPEHGRLEIDVGGGR